jgi:hypothetical protein
MPKKPEAKLAHRSMPGARNAAAELPPTAKSELRSWESEQTRSYTADLKKEHPPFHGRSLHDSFHSKLAQGDTPATAIARLTELLRWRYKDPTSGAVSPYVWTVPALPAAGNWWLIQYFDQELDAPSVAVRLPDGNYWSGFDVFLYGADTLIDGGKTWRMEWVSLPTTPASAATASGGSDAAASGTVRVRARPPAALFGGPDFMILARPKKPADVDDGIEPMKIPTFDNSNKGKTDQPNDAPARRKPGPKSTKNWKMHVSHLWLRAQLRNEGELTYCKLAELLEKQIRYRPKDDGEVGKLIRKVLRLLDEDWKKRVVCEWMRAQVMDEGEPTAAALAEFCRADIDHRPNDNEVGKLVDQIRRLL